MRSSETSSETIVKEVLVKTESLVGGCCHSIVERCSS